jgi:hypothetical protein
VTLFIPDQSSKSELIAQAQYRYRMSHSPPEKVALNEPSSCCKWDIPNYRVMNMVSVRVRDLVLIIKGRIIAVIVVIIVTTLKLIGEARQMGHTFDQAIFIQTR